MAHSETSLYQNLERLEKSSEKKIETLSQTMIRLMRREIKKTFASQVVFVVPSHSKEIKSIPGK